jgi:hypothetical protein
MYLLTPFDFLCQFPEKLSVVFVGNAPSLKEEGLGDWIDSYDIVIRFNECPVKGFERDVGRRTNIVVANPYPKGRTPLSLPENGVVVIIVPQTRRPPSPELENWTKEYGVLFTYTPDLVQVENVVHKAGLTTGVYGLHLLSRLLKPSKVAVTGFTMFFQDTAHHYWNQVTPKGLQAHDVEVEASVFINICNSLRCPVEITEDIAWVSRQIGIPLSGKTKLRPLLSAKWKM